MRTKLYPNLKCPKCGSDRIHSEDIYDLEGAEIEGENALIEQCIGVCRNCGAHLQWEQAYKFVGFRDVYVAEVEGAD